MKISDLKISIKKNFLCEKQAMQTQEWSQSLFQQSIW